MNLLIRNLANRAMLLLLLLPMNSFASESDRLGSERVILIVALLVLLIVGLSIALFAKIRSEARLQRHDLALTRQVKLFESLVDSVVDAVFIADPDWIIISANKTVSTIFDDEPEHYVGLHASTLFISRRMFEVIKTNAEKIELTLPVEVELHRCGGDNSIGESTATKIETHSGELMGYLITVRDISDKLAREEELAQSQKLEALGNLAGSIAHDFNNILGVILGYTEIAKISMDDPAEVKESLDRILMAVDRADGLTNQILTLSRGSDEDLQVMEFGQLVKDAVELFSISVPANIKLDVRFSEVIMPVLVSQIQIEQVILNLATNAVHAMEGQGGELTLALKRVVLKNKLKTSHGVLPAGPYAIFTVSDTGEGIKKKDIGKIFDPFFTTKKHKKGTGIGLATVYNILKTHHAVVNLITEEKVGTIFEVYFPVVEQTSVEALEQESKVIKGRGQRILFVDDDETLVKIGHFLLLKLGYEVDCFVEPEEAWLAFKSDPKKYSMVISDQMMPNMTGTELLAEIRGMHSAVPFIICTGFVESVTQADKTKLNVCSILKKPYSMLALSECIGANLK